MNARNQFSCRSHESPSEGKKLTHCSPVVRGAEKERAKIASWCEFLMFSFRFLFDLASSSLSTRWKAPREQQKMCQLNRRRFGMLCDESQERVASAESQVVYGFNQKRFAPYRQHYLARHLFTARRKGRNCSLRCQELRWLFSFLSRRVHTARWRECSTSEPRTGGEREEKDEKKEKANECYQKMEHVVKEA